MPYTKKELKLFDNAHRKVDLIGKLFLYNLEKPEKRNIGGLSEILELGEKGIFLKTCEEIDKEYWDEIKLRILTYEAENNKAA